MEVHDNKSHEICGLRPGRHALLRLGLTVGVAVIAELGVAENEPSRHWSFQALSQPEPPPVKGEARTRTPIDRFILSELEKRGLTFSREADPSMLVRRAYLDLLGLLPTPEESEMFLAKSAASQADAAFEALVDRLLASPHFGERWGRHWLDWAGYVDVLGGDNDAGRIKFGEGKWFYRDYVVRSYNQDKPFDRFLIEQLAGDELVDWRAAPKFTEGIRELLIATGFLRTASDDTDEDELNTLDIRHDVLQRTGEIVANNLLSLTLQCAKCHDHKYEPISQRDYYRFLGIFSPAFNPDQWVQPQKRALPAVSNAEKAEIELFNAPFNREIALLEKRQETLRQPYKEQLRQKKLERVPEPIRSDTKAAIETAPDQRTEVQKYLASKFEKELTVKPEEITAALNDVDKKALAQLGEEIEKVKAKRRGWATLQAVYDVGPPTPMRILNRGNHTDPGETVEPGVPAVLCGTSPGAGNLPGLGGVAEGPGKGMTVVGQSSGRRLALGVWLTAPGSRAEGLAARVYVNRLWQQLFGKGIVETSDNLGVSGARPAHPELLEWLAAEFVRGGWRAKPIIKLMMISTVYRQAADVGASEFTALAERSDPGNQLLWRQRLRRLESEVIRDAVLCASGALDRTMGQEPLWLETRPDGLVQIRDRGLPGPFAKNRRSLYVLARRNYHLSVLNTFDQPAVATQCARRSPSAVVAQSLTMMNDRFILEQAGAFADRLLREISIAGTDGNRGRVDRAFRIAVGRAPTPEEVQWSLELLERHRRRYSQERMSVADVEKKALAHLCHTLLNTSEFLYLP